MTKTRHKWTTSEVELVRKLSHKGKTIREIAEQMGLTYGQVLGCVKSRGISPRERKYITNPVERPWTIPWTDSELMYLTLLRRQRKTWVECAECLGRTVGDCRRALSRHPDYFTERSLLCLS